MISVVIPCRNEVKNIAECVESIYASHFEQFTELEVIVVDGQSDDGTLEIIAELALTFQNLVVIENQKRVTPVAFNLGIKASKGGFVQIIGARQVISPNYLWDSMMSIKTNPDIWCVGGRVENVFQSEESKKIGLAMSSPFGVGGGNFRVLKASSFTDTVGTPMYRREVFDRIGYFDESLVRNQDDEFNYRVVKAGGKIFLNADILIKYYVRAKISNLFKQYFQYGYWKVFVNKKHRTLTTLRQLVPLFLVLSLIVGMMSIVFFPWMWFPFVGGILLYLLIAIFFAYKVADKNKNVIPIATIFPVLHLSYGYGYLIGLIHFFVLRKDPSIKSKSLSRA